MEMVAAIKMIVCGVQLNLDRVSLGQWMYT